MDKSFISIIETSIKQNWDLDALTDYKGGNRSFALICFKTVFNCLPNFCVFPLTP